MKLWYNHEASEWTQALPIGNGHMGAMCYGGAEGRFDLSESTCWSGCAQPAPFQPGAAQAMEQARAKLMAGEYDKAECLLKNCTGIKGNYGTQTPMGRLRLSVEAPLEHCIRSLELEDGLTLDELQLSGRRLFREGFVSNPDKIMAVRLQAQDGLSLPPLCLWLEGWSQPCSTVWKPERCALMVRGRALENIHSDGLTGVQYFMELVYVTDGTVSWNRRGLIFENASFLTVRLSAATDLFDSHPSETCALRLKAVQSMDWETLKARHIAEHRAGMERCRFSMPDGRGDLPTDERIRAFAEHDGGDDGLIALFFQYGRYLIFNSSRPDSLLPAALQGVWNDDRACRMEWTDDMHLDINTQMNYYPVEATGLGDCVMPLLRWIKDVLMPNGQIMARTLYGADGWGAHTISNAFGWAAPGWDVDWGMSVSCGGWVAMHIWEHYLYTRDLDFLKEYYPILYGSARFLKSLLKPDPQTGLLITVPSYSPENLFLWNGKPHSLSAGSTFDTTVARNLFSIVREAAAILSNEDEFTRTLAEIIDRLPPYRVGKHGQLMEWFNDFDEACPDHRHTSHLLALHPFNAIDPEQSPQLRDAIQTTLKRRLGDDAQDIVCANWAGALLILYFARLLDGEQAGAFVKPMISFLSRENMMITHQGATTSITGGIYELDGNTGFTAAVTEMLMQSYGGVLRLLPALPSAWKTGRVDNLRAQGGHLICMEWNETEMRASVLAERDDALILRCFGREQPLSLRKGERYLFHFDRT